MMSSGKANEYFNCRLNFSPVLFFSAPFFYIKVRHPCVKVSYVFKIIPRMFTYYIVW